MVVIYAEKPDMGEKIAAALGGPSFHKQEKKNGFYKIQYKGKDYQVTWGQGHLCALADASGYNSDYKNWRNMPVPFIPEEYKIVLNLKSRNPVKQLYSVVNSLFKQADMIINATDFDREGELIFYYLYAYSHCQKPVMRMKLASTTKDGITSAFDNLLNNSEFTGLVSSARCRSIADWVVGCNLTVAMTLANGGKNVIPVGRVQTPTLAMVVKRDLEIAGFKPTDYYVVEGTFTTANGETYKGVHKTRKCLERAEAEVILEKCGSNGVVTNIEKKDAFKSPPYLYSLDTIQMDANSNFGYTLDQTLDIIQKLYEKGFVTYPRTDSQFLPEDMFNSIQKIHKMLKTNGYGELFNQDAEAVNMAKHKSLFFNDSKVGSHYAIIPTEQAPSGLSADEKKIYGLIADSVIRMLYPDARFEKTKAVTSVNGEEFITNGSVLAEKGWMFVHGNSKEELLPALEIGNSVQADCKISAKKTEPPKTYTDKTLLAAMKTAGKDLEDEDLRKLMAEQKIEGIGTVATRASIVKQLITRGLLEREKNKIHSTAAGRELIKSVPVEEVKSAVLTAQCEKDLTMIMENKENPEQFLNGLYENVRKWCGEVKTLQKGTVHSGSYGKEDNTLSLMCPVCGNPLRKMNWGYGCSNYQNGCRFSVGKICGKLLTESQLKTLLSKERVGPISGFVKKDGSKFEASLVLEKEEENGEIKNYKISFAKHTSLKDKVSDLYARCPKCGGKIVKGQYGWICEKGCKPNVPYELCKRKIEPDMAEALFTAGQTPVLDGFFSDKKQKYFSAGLKMDGDRVSFYFPSK